MARIGCSSIQVNSEDQDLPDHFRFVSVQFRSLKPSNKKVHKLNTIHTALTSDIGQHIRWNGMVIVWVWTSITADCHR